MNGWADDQKRRALLTLAKTAPGGVLSEGAEQTGSPVMRAGLAKAPDVAADPVAAVKRVDPKTPLHQWAGYAFVHLGAVYEVCGVPVDLLQQFCVEHKLDRRHAVDVRLPQLLVGGLADWGAVLQAVPRDWDDRLNLWLLNQCFVRRGGDGRIAVWWRPRRDRRSVFDPALKVADPGKTVAVSFYLPYGNVGRTAVAPAADGRMSMTFDRTAVPPDGTAPVEVAAGRPTL